MLKKYFPVIALISVSFTICLTQNIEAHQQNPNNIQNFFLSMNWSVGSETEKNFIGNVSKDQILNLFIELDKKDREGGKLLSWKDLKEINDEYRDTLETEEEKEMTHLIAEYQVYDLNNDGQYELLVSTNISAVVYYLSAICKVGNTIKVKHFDKPYHLEDINKDGTEEILIHTFLAYKTWTIGEGSVVWFDIYQWNGSEFILANNKFPEFYEKKLLDYKETLQKLSNLDPTKEAKRRINNWYKTNEENRHKEEYVALAKRLQQGRKEAIEASKKAIERAETVLILARKTEKSRVATDVKLIVVPLVILITILSICFICKRKKIR